MSERHRQAGRARWAGSTAEERIAFGRLGGRAAQRSRRGHRWTLTDARRAGADGGRVSPGQWTPEQARRYGREGGRISGIARASEAQIERRFAGAKRTLRQTGQFRMTNEVARSSTGWMVPTDVAQPNQPTQKRGPVSKR